MMRAMKLLTSLLGATLLFAFTINSQAAPRSATQISEYYLVPERDLAGWSAGIFVRERERDIRFEDSALSLSLEETRTAAYVGYQLINWITAYIYGGANDTKPAESRMSGSGGGTVFGASIEFNLLSHMLKDPELDEDRIRIHSTVSYTRAEAEAGLLSGNFSEVEADITLSLVNEIEGNKRFLPQAIALYAGGLVSSLQGDLDETGDSSGFKGGVDILFTRHITLSAGVENLDNTGVTGSLNVAF